MNDLDIDETWIDDFEKVEQFYNGLYMEQLQNIEIYFLYINRKNELYHIKKNRIEIDNGKLMKERLIFLLKKNYIYKKKRFHPVTIIKYNINLRPKNIIHYLKNTNNYQFISIENGIENISWDDSVPLFHELNSLFIIYNERVKANNTTKRIYIRDKKNKTKSKYA